MEQFAIYLWSISTNLQSMCLINGLFGIFLGGFLWFLAQGDSDGESFLPVLKNWFISGCVCIVLFALIPDRQSLALIFAYPYIKSGVQNVTQSKQMQKLSQVSTLYLDKVIKDLQKTN